MGRSRSPDRRRSRSRDRGYGGGGGYRSPPRRRSAPRSRGNERISLLIRNLDPMSNSIAEDLRRTFERYGTVKDVYIPLDYYTKRPKPFAFVEFINFDEATDAKRAMDRRDFQGRQIDVVFAQERRKTPDQMRTRDTPIGSSRDSRSPRRRDYSRSPRRDERDRDRDRSPPKRDDRRRDDRDASPTRRERSSSRSPRRNDEPVDAKGGDE